MTEEIKTTDNNQKMSVYCKTCICKSCEQASRLEQENKRYKQLLQGCPTEDDDCGFCEIDKRNKELERENNALKQENLRLFNELIELRAKNIEYKHALEEIREIINQPCDNCKYNKNGITCSIGDCGEGKLKIIENKINEALDIG